MPRTRARTRDRLQPLAVKVPEITVMFWVLKLLTTGMGEAMSDFLGSLSVPLAGAVGIFGMWIAIRLQLRTREYRAPAYWFAVMMVAVFGTMAADGVHDGVSAPYPVTTTLYALLVAAVFVLWYRSEKTLSIHTITTRRRENYYWAAVLATFALGTAAGDLTATTLHLGFLGSAGLFAAIIAVPAFAWWRSALNPILTFWAAYVDHTSTRRVVRRLVWQAALDKRPGARRRDRQRGRTGRVRRARGLRGAHQARCPGSGPPAPTCRSAASATPEHATPEHAAHAPSAHAPSRLAPS